MDSLYSILKFYRICLIFIQFINTYPEQLHAMKVFKDSLFPYARLCVTKHFPKFATSNEWLNFENQP